MEQSNQHNDFGVYFCVAFNEPNNPEHKKPEWCSKKAINTNLTLNHLCIPAWHVPYTFHTMRRVEALPATILFMKRTRVGHTN